MQIGDLEPLLQSHEAFRALPPGELTSLANKVTLRVFRLGETVIKANDPDRALYIVFAGRARLLEEEPDAEPVTLAILEKGQTFGEHGLFGAPGYAVRAAGDLVVLRLDERHFKTLAAMYPDFAAALEHRVHLGGELAFLSRLKIFSALKLPDLRRLAAQLQKIELKAGQELFAEGDLDDTAYVVREGRLRLLKSFDGAQRQVGVTRIGDLIGEMGLLVGLPRLLTAVAATQTVVLALSRQVFEDVVSDEDREEAMLTATNELLQLQAFKREAQPGAPSARVTLRAERMKAETGWFAASYPVIRVGAPALSGLACLGMTDAFHGRNSLSQSEIDRRLAAEEPETMDTLARMAEELGYLTRQIRITPAQLRELQLPAVIERHPGEFAVLFHVNDARVIVADPSAGLKAVPRAEFADGWNGRTLCLTHLPSAVFNDTRPTAIVRQFFPFVIPYRAAIVALVALSLLAQLFGLVGPLLNKVLIDSVFVTFDRRLLNLLLVGMLIVTAFQMATNSLREYLAAHVMRRISAAVQLRFFDHILSLPIRTLGAWRVGDFLVRMNENDKLLQLVSESSFRVVLNVAAIVIDVLLLFMMSATMAPVALGFVAAYGALMAFSSPRLRAASSAVFEARKVAESHFIESISGIQTVKSLALESHTYDRAFTAIHTLKRSEFRMAHLAFNVGQVGALLQQASVVVVLGWGASLALEGQITTGELVAFNALLGATLGPLASLIGVWDEMQEVRLSFERTADVLRLERERNPKDAAVFPLRGDVRIDHVTFRYRDDGDPVLRDVTLSARPGQKIALVGRSGSGKTTLAGLLLGLYPPTEGRVLVDEIDLALAHKSALRRQVGYVEQQPHLFSGTIRDNIAKADPTAGLETIVAAATMAGAHSFIQQLPLAYDTQIGERGMTLSGGQKQRVVIARALLNNPRMLVLDEATSALDTESEQAIQRNLDSMMAGKTSFVIAHRLSTVRNADKIVVLDEGRIVEEGTHAELMAQQGLYHYLATATD